MDAVKMGRFLGALRREHHLTQEAAGEALGVTNKTISRWETGQYLPPVDMLPALAALYGVSTDELLAGARTQPACPSPAIDSAATTPLPLRCRRFSSRRSAHFAHFAAIPRFTPFLFSSAWRTLP